MSKVIKAEINIDQTDKTIREQAKRATIFEMPLSWKDAEKGAFHRMASVEEGCIDDMQSQLMLQNSCDGEHDDEELRDMVCDLWEGRGRYAEKKYCLRCWRKFWKQLEIYDTGIIRPYFNVIYGTAELYLRRLTSEQRKIWDEGTEAEIEHLIKTMSLDRRIRRELLCMHLDHKYFPDYLKRPHHI